MIHRFCPIRSRQWTALRRLNALVCACVGLTVLASCAHWPEIDRSEHRELALQRWQSCLSRQWQVRQRLASPTPATVIQDCEGHRRDVLNTYPEHLAPQLDRMLRSHAQQRLAERLSEKPNGQSHPVSLP